MMRIFSLLLSVALSVGCGGTIVAQQVETQAVAPRIEQTSAVATGGHNGGVSAQITPRSI